MHKMKTNGEVFPRLVLLLMLRNQMISVISHQGFTLVKHANMEQKNFKLRQLNVKTLSECLEACLGDCRCAAFDMRSGVTPADGLSNCYLNRYRNNLGRLVYSEAFSHFNIKQEEQHCDASKQCRSSVNCCLTSNPCSNGGTCTPTDDIRDRFKCACPEQFTGKFCIKCVEGYTGKNCATKITSCRGYANGSRVPQTYYIRDAENILLNVFCDFEKDSKISWTLVQSYSLGNAAAHRKSLLNNFEKSTENPVENWFSYRLSLDQMNSIQDNSTKWRITCDFDKNLTATINDSMRGFKTDLDIMTYNNRDGECRKVDYINIRGYSCFNCTVPLWQSKLGKQYGLHTDTGYSFRSLKKCDFRVEDFHSCDDDGGEDNFGHYICANARHRCSATNNSTTQTWLGG